MNAHILYLTRVLHMLQDEDGNDVDNHGANTPFLLVALHSDNVMQRLLSLPIFSARWSWTRPMIYAVQAYARWQESEVSGVRLKTLSLRRVGSCVLPCVSFTCTAPGATARVRVTKYPLPEVHHRSEDLRRHADGGLPQTCQHFTSPKHEDAAHEGQRAHRGASNLGPVPYR